MGKTIAAKDISQEIKDELMSRGYNIVNDKYNGYADVLLYNSQENSLGYLNNFDNIVDMNCGAFIIDINNKTIEEIINMIENRSYSSLF